MLDKYPSVCYSNLCPLRHRYGGVAQLARAFGSYPKCHRFESSRRYHKLPPKREGVYILGALVKRSRHRPFTAVTRVRFPYASPYGGIAQLVERPPHTRKVTDSSSVVSTIFTLEIIRFQGFFLYIDNFFGIFCFRSRKCPETRPDGSTNHTVHDLP